MYGQVKKRYQRRRIVRVKHVIRLLTRPAFTKALGYSGKVNTACIERATLRRAVRWPLWHDARGLPPCKLSTCRLICTGGKPVSTSCVLMPRCAKPWYSYEKGRLQSRQNRPNMGPPSLVECSTISDGSTGSCSSEQCNKAGLQAPRMT
jgi:hypothetical protein